LVDGDVRARLRLEPLDGFATLSDDAPDELRGAVDEVRAGSHAVGGGGVERAGGEEILPVIGARVQGLGFRIEGKRG
jgi:hypothetical protein